MRNLNIVKRKNMTAITIKGSKTQGGFTLIEIAIVLVIIGLLLGGVLQGQQLIENSRVRSATNSFNGTAAGAFSYQDRYGRLPGDDNAGDVTNTAIRARGDNWATVIAGNGNGVVDAALADTFAGTGEAGDFFQQMRAAGFLAGDSALVDANALPTNPFGGLIGITTAAMGGGLTGTKICMSNVGGGSAIALDTQLDDGDGATGRMRATLNTGATSEVPTNTALAAPYSEDDLYTICYRI